MNVCIGFRTRQAKDSTGREETSNGDCHVCDGLLEESARRKVEPI